MKVGEGEGVSVRSDQKGVVLREYYAGLKNASTLRNAGYWYSWKYENHSTIYMCMYVLLCMYVNIYIFYEKRKDAKSIYG